MAEISSVTRSAPSVCGIANERRTGAGKNPAKAPRKANRSQLRARWLIHSRPKEAGASTKEGEAGASTRRDKPAPTPPTPEELDAMDDEANHLDSRALELTAKAARLRTKAMKERLRLANEKIQNLESRKMSSKDDLIGKVLMIAATLYCGARG